MKYHDQAAAALADAMLAGASGPEAIVERASVAIGLKRWWVRAFIRRAYRHFGPRLAYNNRHDLIVFIRNDLSYSEWAATHRLRVLHYSLDSPSMNPSLFTLKDNALPELPTPADLAAWLGITMSELDWYSDTRGMIRSGEGGICHYHYRWIAKRSDAFRLIESPKDRLRAMQRRILHEILDHIPPHASAHGFRRGCSCMTNVEPHIGKTVVLCMDLRNFFGSISAGRINALFKSLGYPHATARHLAGLCTNSVPTGVFQNVSVTRPEDKISWSERRNLRTPHLPQGAPTSPALANLCALHLDFRLAALAGSMSANYTRYADDLAFSGDEPVRRSAGRLPGLIAAIAMEEGFDVNFRKTRVMHKSDCQRLTGIVVNEKTNMDRREYDRLKAILHNCLRSGPDSQNREGHGDFRAHLLGRVNHLKTLNLPKGENFRRFSSV
jgi:hypothetical protein